MKFRKIDLATWSKMLEIARDYDLNRNGLYDARSGAINIWVSPDDKPVDWNFKITRGALKYPRAFLATIYSKIENDEVELEVEIANYSRREWIKSMWEKGEINYSDYREMLKRVSGGTKDEWKWVIEKVEWLIDLAEKEKNFISVLRCPYCGKTEFKLLNEFIDCLLSHGLKIKSVIIGRGLVTEKGFIPFEDFYITKRR